MSRRVVIAVVAVAVTLPAVGWLVLRGRHAPVRNDDPIHAASIVMLGDSITAQADWSELVDESFVNRGFPGYTTAQLVPVAQEVAADRPRIVFVLTGTNDIRDAHPPSWTVDHLDEILTALKTRSPTTRVVVQSVLPRADAPAAVAAANAAIMRLASERDVEFLDLHAAFDDGSGALRPSETSDGIHLSPAGYTRWADLVRRTVDDLTADKDEDEDEP